jgi:H+-translocating NAD(P) transhydrogenase subunit beta
MLDINLLHVAYLIASLTFIAGLKMLGSPETARSGNLIAAAGMLIAIVATIWYFYFFNTADQLHQNNQNQDLKLILIFLAIAIGTAIGWVAAKKVKMTSMPEMVSMFNGMGGACAALIALMEFDHNVGDGAAMSTVMGGLIIGSVSFSGSMIAFAKLNGTIRKPLRFPALNIFNLFLIIFVIALAAFVTVSGSGNNILLYVIFILALTYGVMLVLPIGGADMPVVISLLNSFTGVAAAFGGFLYGNAVMLTGGILVGSAGTILTLVMCRAMNRPLSNVLFSGFGDTAVASGKEGVEGTIKDINVSDVAVLLNYSKKVIIVPGYGLAVAQAQHVIHELETILEERGVEVKYAIHPVAGRMPGHMNVLLAESNVDYGKLLEMEEINPEFDTTDVVLVIGANDVVNPAAKTDPSSPIYGMPILDVENAKNILVNKRSMSAGYAGIENELFYNPKTSMVFGDAKAVLTNIVTELKGM